MIASEDDQRVMNAINHVASSLLLLFKAELNAPLTARLRKKVSPADKSGVFRCTLEVSHNDQVKIRDVVVGFCSGDQNTRGYTVTAAITADYILGIHIPKTPLTNIDEYIDILRQKKKFVQKMSPFFVHLPAEASVILNKLPQFRNPPDSSSMRSEDDYIHLLKHNIALQSYFKVDDTFAFFSDLSSCDLYKDEVGKLHDIGQINKQERTQILNALWDQGEIETLYNEKVAASTYRINELFLRLKNDVDRKIRYRKDLAAIPDYTKRNWFAEWLNSERLDNSAAQYPLSFIEEIEQLFDVHFKGGQAAIDEFTKTIEAFAAEKYYDKNKRNIEGMINNSLNLLSGLYKAQVACRNLKPENLLIKKKAADAHLALSASGTYTIGIIDATACVLQDHLPEEEEVAEPLQKGFSAYITPSHFLSTRQLKDYIDNEKLVLRMQDLYAAIGIIFFTATGTALFIDTGNLAHQVACSENIESTSDNIMSGRFRKINNQFWSTAESELRDRLVGDRSRLEQIHATIPEHFTCYQQKNSVFN